MLLYVLRWDIPDDQTDEYLNWAKHSIVRCTMVPGVVELTSYRPVAGESEVVTIFKFKDFDSWSAWFNSNEIQAIFDEMFKVVTNAQRELWEPSPIITEPIRPQQEELD